MGMSLLSRFLSFDLFDIRCQSPDQCGDPAEESPPKKQVQDDDGHQLSVVPKRRDNQRRSINQEQPAHQDGSNQFVHDEHPHWLLECVKIQPQNHATVNFLGHIVMSNQQTPDQVYRCIEIVTVGSGPQDQSSTASDEIADAAQIRLAVWGMLKAFRAEYGNLAIARAALTAENSANPSTGGTLILYPNWSA